MPASRSPVSSRASGPIAPLVAQVGRLRERIEGRRARREGRKVRRRLAGPKLLTAFAAAYPQAFFIEVGANDGEQHDLLRPFILGRAWRGIMVEPVPFVFDRLRANYGHLDRVALENVAIADRDGELPFYHLAEAADPGLEGLPRWYDGIGSFAREHVLRHREDIPDIDERIVCTPVRAVRFQTLCDEHGVEAIDLLLIDTEGYDAEIVRGIDLSANRPALLVYEHFHLDANARRECRERLEHEGYRIMEEGFDTWCLRADVPEALESAWRRLRPAVPAVSASELAR